MRGLAVPYVAQLGVLAALRAWAGALGIEASDIAGYISEFMPAVLRSDTSAVNHGFSRGLATRRLSVQQAGTTVLVDRFGARRGCGALAVIRCRRPRRASSAPRGSTSRGRRSRTSPSTCAPRSRSC
ncbi:DUF6777 domain-containing protein [Actinomycetes bacterium KLBMP 9759]